MYSTVASFFGSLHDYHGETSTYGHVEASLLVLVERVAGTSEGGVV